MRLPYAVQLISIVLVNATANAADAPSNLTAELENARAGDVIRVPAGIHQGPIEIRQSISLIAEAGAILDGGGQGDVVRITAPDVTLRGFSIRNSGAALDKECAGILVVAPRAHIENNRLQDVLFGVLLKAAPGSVIRGNTIGGMHLDIARRGDGIRLWQSSDTIVENNVVRNSRDVVMWFSSGITLRGNHVSHCRYGMHFMYTDDNTLEGNVLEDNSVGAFLMYSRNLKLRGNTFARSRGPSGYGLGLKDMDGISAEDNSFIGNRIGLYVDNSPQSLNLTDDFTRNLFAYNDIGIAFLPNVKRNRFADNSFVENLQQVAGVGSGEFTGNEFTVDGRGNFWSDYRGYDADRDGVGDLPYKEESLFDNLMEREPKLRLFLHSPAQQAIELAARAFPIVQPQPRVQDDAPLMAPIALHIAASDPVAPRSMWLVSAGLLAPAVACLVASRRMFSSRAWHGANS